MPIQAQEAAVIQRSLSKDGQSILSDLEKTENASMMSSKAKGRVHTSDDKGMGVKEDVKSDSSSTCITESDNAEVDKRDMEEQNGNHGDLEGRTDSMSEKETSDFAVEETLSSPMKLAHVSSSPAILPPLSNSTRPKRVVSLQPIPPFKPKNLSPEPMTTVASDVSGVGTQINSVESPTCDHDQDLPSNTNAGADSEKNDIGESNDGKGKQMELKGNSNGTVVKKTRFVVPKLSMETQQQKEEASRTSKFAAMARSSSRSKSGGDKNGTTSSTNASILSSNATPNSSQRSVMDRDDEGAEPGVVLVRSCSSSRGGMANVSPAIISPDDTSSILSGDSQEIYALRQMGYAIASRKTAKTMTAIQEPSVTGITTKTVKTVKTAKTSGAVYEAADSTRTEKTNHEGHQDTVSAGGTMVSKSTKGVSFDSDDTESHDDRTMDSFFRYNESEDDASDLDDGTSGNDSTTDLGTLNLHVSSFANSKKLSKSDMSEVSGSFDDDELLTQGQGLPDDTDADIEVLQNAKKTKRIFKIGKGLGKKKGDMKTVKTEIKDENEAKGGLLGLKKFKRTKMKKSAVKAPKKVIKKKKGVQLRTIRLKGDIDQDDIVPRKGDPGVKVMKVSKLTAQGYVSAEFTSLDPNNTPLHIACLTHYPKRFILDVLFKGDHLEGIFTENSSGELPIHYAVMDTRGVDTDVLEALIEKFPESVEHRNIDKSLPIHVACQVGAPSLYSIERLLEINPDFSIAQNDLRVPLNDEEMEDSNGWCGALCLDWFATDNEKYVRFETGWTPLHLAAVNGAPPEVIEAIVDANPECMNVRTNKKRTAVECAKNVIIKALLNDVELHKVENTFNAIEVMQSYEKECRLKEELALKAGIVKSALESYEKYGNWWMTATEMLPNREKLDGIFHKEKDDRFDVYDDYGDDDWGDEKGMTNLHRAILKKADPETVHRIIEEWPECLDIKSTYDRTPIDCAKQLIIRGLLNQDPVSTFASTFVSLQVMQAYREDDDESTDEEGNIISGTKNHRKDDTFDATAALSQADVNYLKTRNRRKWGSKGDTYEYMKEFVEMNLVGGSLMGKLVLTDDDAAIQPFDYFPPANLRHVNLRINLPVGFRRLRRALLGQRTDFLRIAVLTERLGCTNITMLPWNKHSKSIGQLRLKKGEKWRDFIGAKKTISYFVPPSEAGDAHMAYESVQIVEYNDYCFAVKAIIKNPDLPYGSEYETHYQIIVIDKGTSNVRMICSSETLITGMKMEDDWQVRNAMRHRMTDFFYALCDAICEHAGSGDKKDQQTDDTELEVDKK